MSIIKVVFNSCIDNDDYQFASKKEAIAIAQSLTTNRVGSFDWNDEGEYKWLSFKEYVLIEIEENGSPLYTYLEGIEPTIKGAEFSHVCRAGRN